MADEIRCAIEIRQDDAMAGPGRITGTLLRYGERAADRPEVFEAGALKWPSNGIVLNRQHSRAAGDHARRSRGSGRRRRD